MEAGTSYPVQFDVEYPDRELNRLTTGFRIFMAIPIAIVLATLGGESTAYAGDHWQAGATFGGLVTFTPLLLILFRQKYPRWWFDWNLELLRFQNRVGAYLALLNDQYPSTDEHQSVRLELPYPDAKQGPQSLAAARQVVARDPALDRAGLPLARGVLRDHLRVVRDPFHRPLPARAVRLRRRRRALDESSDRLRVRARHGSVPAVQPLALAGGSVSAWPSLLYCRSSGPSPRRRSS